MIWNREHIEFRPEAKNAEWFSRLTSYYRTYWRPIVEPQVYADNMALILAKNNMKNVMDMFKNPKALGFEIIPIAVIEKIRNVLFGERLEAGLSASVKAVDPSSEKDRNDDRTIIKTRKDFEQLMTFMQKSIGMPEYRLASEKKAGANPFNGNVEAFDEMGLEDDNEQDLSYFFRTHYKLLYEMDAQEIINSYMEANELDENVENWCNDIMAVKTIAGRVYVNQVTGGMDYQYFQPDRIKHIPGRKASSKGAVCVGFEDSATVAEAISMIGNEFDWEKHIALLVNAVNFYNRRNIVEISEDGKTIFGKPRGRGEEICTIDEFQQMKVGIGYIETKAVDAVGYKIGKDFLGNPKTYEVPFDTPVEPGSQYQKDVRHKWTTYKAHFVATSTNQQVLFNFGKLYHQTIEGSEDEYSNYSIFYKQMSGPTVAQIAAPWIELAQETFYKFKWMVRKAKPKGRSYSYESLVKMAKHLYGSGDLKVTLPQVIKMFEEGINEMFVYPEINGEKIGGGTNPNADLPNGLDPTAITFKAILEWCYQMIASDLGVNDMRTGQQMDPNSGYRLQMTSMEQSRNATKYINYLIDTHVKECSKRFLLTGLDIIRYKDTVPYKYLRDIVGQSVIDRLGGLLSSIDEGKKPDVLKGMHRQGIFIHSLSSYDELQQIKQAAYQSFQKGEIPFEVLMLIIETKDYKKAAYILSYEKKRAEKIEMQKAERLHQQQVELSNVQSKNQMAVIDRQGDWRLKEVKAKGYFDLMVQKTDNEGKENVTGMKLQAEPGKQQAKTEGNLAEYAGKKTIDSEHQLLGEGSGSL